MKVLGLVCTPAPLKVVPIGDRLYPLANDTKVAVITDEGTFEFLFKAKFVTNFRSGGTLVDLFIDQIGDEKKALIYLIHDAIYTPCATLNMEHPLSRKLGDELLRAGLLYCGMSEFKAALVYYSVRAFGESAYMDDDALTSSNSKLFKFEWTANDAYRR